MTVTLWNVRLLDPRAIWLIVQAGRPVAGEGIGTASWPTE
jgi:hypothetical protein